MLINRLQKELALTTDAHKYFCLLKADSNISIFKSKNNDIIIFGFQGYFFEKIKKIQKLYILIFTSKLKQCLF